ncbi:MAG: hypothetical protein JSW23_07375 [Planctomycetota bacterium]|nr:MAG: hypothetical protein JSW23_07375 [Planctomycetota bacterium]UCF44426.1 MAG: hypothetical protein JSV99_05840 [Planctomycetota bacterium]
MEATRKPSVIRPVLVTVALVCCLIALLLMVVTGKYSNAILFFQVLTLAFLIAGAILAWRRYGQKLVDFEVQNRLSKEARE